MPEAML
ncbi:hypothetical protein CIB84_014225 [Bambusicola thoracicus]|nr:hypothetical protein CIB84_014225 [Bambusicola thoracicus]